MNVTGATACHACQAGRFTSLFASWNCTLCANGTISVREAAVCTGCAPGKYAVGRGNKECTFCGEDTYQPFTGTTVCITCPLNTGARNVMGICTGACKGSITKQDCLCAPGFTRFGQTSDECVAFGFSVTKMGQSTACPAKNNIIGVTITANAQLTTAVQSITILHGGEGYAPASLQVLEPGGVGFVGRAFTDLAAYPDGRLTGIIIDEGGSQFTGSPNSVAIYFSPGCAKNDDGCTTTLQEGSIATIQTLNKGSGYLSGKVLIIGGGGSGAEASFTTDTAGSLSGVHFDDVAKHGRGYCSSISLDLVYQKVTRCDEMGKDGVPRSPGASACRMSNTITDVLPGSGMTSECDTDVRLITSGGGGSGFYASVTKISPLGGIQKWYIVNHGVNYTSDPDWLLINVDGSTPRCKCQGVAAATVGSFNPCLSFFRARGALLSARPALNASLKATTGSSVVISGLEKGIMTHPKHAVPIYDIGPSSITAGETQSCGILTNGTGVCWGKSEQYFTKDDVQTWTCGYRARYWRFTPMVSRSGTSIIQLADLQFYVKDSSSRLPVVEATTPGGTNPPGLVADLAADDDPETKWAVLNMMPLQFDFGAPVAVDRYRWMTASDDAASDPVQWRIEAANDPEDGSHWIKIHEVSSYWHGSYTVATAETSRGVVYYLRNTWTRFWTGGCSIPVSQTWRAISVQAFHGCGINSAGIGHCWGHNSMAQLKFPESPCDSCLQQYDTYCSCTSANFFSIVYRKIRINAVPGQCDENGRCYVTYPQGTCTEKKCKYIYKAAECSRAGKALGYIEPSANVMAPSYSAFSPKGCYLVSDPRVMTRFRFNANNASSQCTEALNCVCRDCPSFSFITYGENAYCGGTFDTDDKRKANELVGAKTVEECEAACGLDSQCDFFTFYPEEASVSCAPCCFKKSGECDLIDPNFVIPKAGKVKDTSAWSDLSAGYLHTCGITMAGALSCWGFDRDGQASPPVAMAGRKWRSVASGKFHSCGILDDLTAHCWGANEQKLNTNQVVPVPGLGSYKWRMLSAGVWHTCGITEEGTLHCWGCGGRDRLGRPIGSSLTGENVDKGQCEVPQPDAGLRWDSVSASEFHTCGVTSSGEAHCWGCECNPSACPSWNSSEVNLGQCDVPVGHQWSQISVGRRHTCGLSIHGRLYCWGCLLDPSKPYFAKNGAVLTQNASARRNYDFGQCHQPPGVAVWMNSAAFSDKAKWESGNLELAVRSDTIVGADYFFGFPIQNPSQVQAHADTSIIAQGVELPRKIFEHATPEVYGGLAVTVCKPGTYSSASGECLPCNRGTYALDCGVASCTACMPGQYSYLGSTVCKACGLGRYAEFYGSTSCSACPGGTYGPVTGAVSHYDGCVDCAPGKYTEIYHVFDEFIDSWQDVGDTSCLVCAKGYYCPGGVGKIQCAPETYNGKMGANSSVDCAVCPHGLRCNGLWPRFTCLASTGFDNGTIFSELSSCERACYSMDRVKGQCLPSQGQNNGCSDGYDENLCGRCIEGYYPEFLGFECKKCPGVWYQAFLLLAYSGLVLAIPLICDLTQVDFRISVYLRIMIFFFQNLDLSLSVNVRWPALLITYVRALRIMNWDLMYTNPQCWFGNTEQTWQLLFLVEVGFPLCTVGMLIFIASSTGFASSWSRHRESNVSRAFWRLLGFYMVWYSVPFVGTFVRAVECSCVPAGYELHRPSWDNCSAMPSPARTALTNNPYVVCHGASHWKEFAGSFSALMCIFIGLPMAFLFLPDIEPSIRNPLPAHKRPVSAMGLLKVVNVGIAKGEKSGTGTSPGTGVAHFLVDQIRQMQELGDMGSDEIERLINIRDEAVKRGNKNEVAKWKQAIVDMEEQCEVCDERVALLQRR